jgi:hypothetical protein
MFLTIYKSFDAVLPNQWKTLATSGQGRRAKEGGGGGGRPENSPQKVIFALENKKNGAS